MIAGHDRGLHEGGTHWCMEHYSMGVNGRCFACVGPPLIDKNRRLLSSRDGDEAARAGSYCGLQFNEKCSPRCTRLLFLT